MAFIFLLLSSLSVLVRTEVESNTTQAKAQIARQNAILGLNIALGKMQQYVGPDQRVTARADILDQDFEVKHPYWTGVWQQDPGATSGFPEKQFLGWLVSGAEEDDRVPANTTEEQNRLRRIEDDSKRNVNNFRQDGNAEYVRLVWQNTAQDDNGNGDGVTAPLVPILEDNQRTGNYAYWVGDEGVKAKFNLTDPYESASSDAERYYRFRIPQKNGVQAIDGLSSLDANDPELLRTTSLQDLAFLGSIISVPKREYFNVTAVSKGLLTDTRNGGLKKDLSILFGQNSSDDALFNYYFKDDGSGNPAEFRFTPDGGNGIPSGVRRDNLPNWGILRDYYFLGDAVSADGKSVASEVPDSSPALYLLGAANGATFGFTAGIKSTEHPYNNDKHVYHQNNPIHPVISFIQWGLDLSFKDDPGTGFTQETIPTLEFSPIIGLYNPHNATISGIDCKGVLNMMPRITIEGIAGPGAGQSVSFLLQEVTRLVGGYQWVIGDVELKPGETRFYAFDQRTHFFNPDPSVRLPPENYRPLKLFSGSGAYEIPLFYWESGAYRPHILASQAGEPDYIGEGIEGEGTTNKFGLNSSEMNILQSFTSSSTVELTVEMLPIPGGNSDISRAGEVSLWVEQPVSTNLGIPRDNRDHVQRWAFYYDESLSASQSVTDSVAGWNNAASNPAIGIRVALRTVRGDTASPGRFLIDSNIRAITSSRHYDGDSGYQTTFMLEADGTSGMIKEGASGYTTDIALANPSRASGYYGPTRRSLGGSEFNILFDVPRPGQPLMSIASFQHAAVGRYCYDPTYIIGNSYANPRIPLDDDRNTAFTSRGYQIFDWSRIVNTRIWDEFFFSTAPMQTTTDIGSWMSNPIADPLPNSRMLPYDPVYRPDGSSVDISNQTADFLSETGNAANRVNHELIAGKLMLDGAFNVNSTSVNAWSAILSSIKNIGVPVRSLADDGDLIWTDDNRVIISRMSQPYGGPFSEVGASSDANFWTGYRALSSDEVELLAASIVDEVKSRGPFVSLAHFINRDPNSSNPSHQQKGALQAALDEIVNTSDLIDDDFSAKLPNTQLLHPEWPSKPPSQSLDASGFPGYVLQSDLLQSLGPIISARTDTFVVRSYGNSLGASGNIESEAWCEAVVQRIPEPVKVSGIAEERDLVDGKDLNASADFALGRTLKILEFRWLSEEEI